MATVVTERRLSIRLIRSAVLLREYERVCVANGVIWNGPDEDSTVITELQHRYRHERK